MVEKLLTNWMSICLYTFVRVREAGGRGCPPGRGRALSPPIPPPHPPEACALLPSMSSVTSSCPRLHVVRGCVLYPSALCFSPVPGL